MPGNERHKIKNNNFLQDSFKLTMSALKTTTYSISELKDHVYGRASVGKQSAEYDKVTEEIGEYAGRVFGHDMKNLVLHSTEAAPVQPVYPGENAGGEDKAVWKEEYSVFTKKRDRYTEEKAKIFAIIMGQCTDALKNRVQSDATYAAMEQQSNVIGLLQFIKAIALGASERVYPPLAAVQAWKRLVLTRQEEGEELTAYYKRFISLVEVVEKVYGMVLPVKIAERDRRYNRERARVEAKERAKMLAVAFMEGADRQVYGFLCRGLSDDHALGDDRYPETMEDALEVLRVSGAKKAAKKVKSDKELAELKKLQLVQGAGQVTCWKCGEVGHVKKECPKWKAAQEAKQRATQLTQARTDRSSEWFVPNQRH